MKTFEEVKQIMLDRAKSGGTYENGYKRVLIASDKPGLLKAVTANWYWVSHSAKIIDAAFLEEHFTEEELTEADIYTREEHRVSTAAFACGSATVHAYNSATIMACNSATVTACDSATIEVFDSAMVEAFDSATVKAFDYATVQAYDSATVKAHGYSTARVYDSVTAEAYDSTTVEVYGDSYVEDCHGGIIPQSGYAIVKDYYARKLYVKKGKFEIIEVE